VIEDRIPAVKTSALSALESGANLLKDLPDASREEVFETLLQAQGGPVRIERIVSHGQASPADFWYDQDEDEWVLVLAGGAVLEILDEAERRQSRRLGPGDSLYLPAHRRHRVAWTSEEEPTVWLACFWRPRSAIE
jgi:cupin 2 domain-containing protein